MPTFSNHATQSCNDQHISPCTITNDQLGAFICLPCDIIIRLQWRHNEHDGVSNHQPHDCLLNGLFRRRSKVTSKLRITGLCAGNSPWLVNSPHKRPVTRKMLALWHHHQDIHDQNMVFNLIFQQRLVILREENSSSKDDINVMKSISSNEEDLKILGR